MDPIASVQTWLYDNLPIGVAILDRALCYVYANSSYAATHGATPAQLLRRPLPNGLRDWTETIQQMADQARAMGHAVERYAVPLIYPRQPSLRRVWDITLLPLFDGESFDGIVLYLLDVTARQETEQLHTSETRLRSILSVAIDAILVIDEGGVIIQTNPAAGRIFGYTVEELTGKPVTLIMPEAFRAEHPRFLERYLHTGVPHIIGTVREVQGIRQDGTLFPCELSVAESREEAHHHIFVGIIRDITERKALQTELESARARLETILNTVPTPLFVIGPDHHIIIANDTARAFYGMAAEGNGFFDIPRVHPDTRAPWPLEEWPIIRALHEQHPITNVEQLVLFPDGREVPLLVHAAPVMVDGRIVAAVGVFQDLTRMKAADRAKDTFLALISHELRSPLATIISWAELSRDDPSVREEAFPIILRNAYAQQRIIGDLLDISRILYGKLTLELEPVDAWETTRQAAEALRGAIEQRGLTLVLDPPTAPLPVLADPVRLEQIINNLLTNAMKFTPADGAITVSGAKDGHEAYLCIRDTGFGIAPEQLTNIFQRFQQVGRERVSDGLGLGLALVRGLVELHGGRIDAASPGLNQGSVFTVRLPLRSDA